MDGGIARFRNAAGEHEKENSPFSQGREAESFTKREKRGKKKTT